MIVMLSLIKEQSGSMMLSYHAPVLFLYQRTDILTVILWVIIFAGILILLFRGGIMSRTVPQQSNEALMQKLFKWKRQVEYNGVTFYIRIVGDTVVEDARKFALLESRKMRKKMRDPNSDEYFMYLDLYNDYTDEELIATAQLAASRSVMEDYVRNNPKRTIDPLGDHPTQEQIENYEAEKEERDEQYIKDMQDAVEQWRKEFENSLSKMPHDALVTLVQRYEIDARCNAVYTDYFETYIVSASIYKDPQYKERMFTVDDYKELPTEVKSLLYNTYNTLNISAEDIKN